MEVNANTQIGIDVLRKAIDANKTQVSNLLKMQQNAQDKLNTRIQKNDTVPKSNVIGSLFDKRV
ncbi:hypothetical protein [Desulfurella sp.]|uniref:hypothetical protein n=1 Tax=Desulfurella sp. TaxID=1962857 RepID=UPI0025C1AD12|nr:hypothetical protein [Desulfurella sp.]